MSDKRIGDYIQTFRGGKFWPLDPRAGEVFAEDVAHALANVCRFSGHVRFFYSVAQHSVHVSENVPESAAFHALLHDAAEAYIGDVARPSKRNFYVLLPVGFTGRWRYATFQEMEHRILNQVMTRFGCSWGGSWSAVKEADDRMLVTEARDLMPLGYEEWDVVVRGKVEPYPFTVEPWSPEKAERRFMERFVHLGGKL